MMAALSTALAPILAGLDASILLYFVCINAAYLTLVACSTWELVIHILSIRGESRARVLGSAVTPSISILAPAYNEEATIAESVTALLALHYANLELVVVNDGSPDRTLDVLKQRFALVPIHSIVWRRIDTRAVRGLYRSRTHPNLLVVDKENGGKADALNAGLNLATGDLVCVIDADTIVDADALQRLARPFLSHHDVLAAGGTIRIANGSAISAGRVTDACAPRNFVAGVQVVEYFRAFIFGRLGWNRLGGNLIISGAFGLFRRDAMIAVGGYTHDTVGEDMELVLKLRRQAYEAGRKHRILFVPDAVAWTECPESLRVLGRQRDRWHRGLTDVLWRHRTMFLNPRYGVVGLWCYPYFVFVELLAPVLELLGWVGLTLGMAAGLLDASFAALFFLLAYGIGAVLSAYSLLLEEWSFNRFTRFGDRVRLLLYLVLESFGYRQLTVVWRLRGIWKFLRGRTDWGRMERRGFAAAAAPVSATHHATSASATSAPAPSAHAGSGRAPATHPAFTRVPSPHSAAALPVTPGVVSTSDSHPGRPPAAA
ncbi:MAG: glycosyl transferase [Gemmatimonadetes bacterium SCN 70-22]|nr:MAG: glycosyl transferase [Gemmatimonadetes bacterium SCN 70-22]